MRQKRLIITLLIIVCPIISILDAQIVINRVEGSLSGTLEKLVEHHSKRTMAPFLNADLEWAYARFPVTEFAENGDNFKKAIDLMIQARRFDARDLIYLSALKLSPEEQQRYLKLIKADGEFWYPNLVPAPNSIAIDFFKYSQGLSSNEVIFNWINKEDKKFLAFFLSQPELINEHNTLISFMEFLTETENAYVIGMDCNNNNQMTWVRVCDVAFNFFNKRYPGKYKLLKIVHTPHAKSKVDPSQHQVDQLDTSPERIQEFKQYFLAKIKEEFPQAYKTRSMNKRRMRR